MINVPLSYKAPYSIIESVEFRLAADAERLKSTLTEDEMADLVNDVAFTECYLKDLKKALAIFIEENRSRYNSTK